ncbi:Uncharacterised protein [uncultured archaeon]|nr:Uncharacterised protein [uncultured archaeon]
MLGLCFGFFFGWVLWKLGVFAGGDVKLFMGLGALNAFTPALISSGSLGAASYPIFPITLFVYSLIAFLPYGMFVVAYKVAKNKKFQKELFKEMKPRVILATNGAVFASGAFVALAQYNVNALALIAAVIIWGFLGKYKTIATIIAVIAALLFNYTLFAEALIAALIISVGFYSLVKLLFSARKVLATEILVKELEEGMIPARSLIKKGAKIVEATGVSTSNLFELIKKGDLNGVKDLFAPKNEIISSNKARGLNDDELILVKKLAAQGKLPKKIWVKESMPFVPTMLLGYLLCIILGDLVITFLGGVL